MGFYTKWDIRSILAGCKLAASDPNEYKSFQNTNTWKFNGSSSLPDEAMSYDTSTQLMQKRGFYQCLMTATDEEVEQFNKEEDDPLLHDDYNNSYMVHAPNHHVPDISISTSPSAGLNIQNTRDFENHIGNYPNTDLTLYHDPSILKAALGKTKLNKATGIFENLKPDQFVGNSCTRVENEFPNTQLCLGSTFNTGDGNTISLAPTFTNIDRGVSSVGVADRFSPNVKSLLSTGLLEGVPVKYISWTRKKQLRGELKGTGYLCSCKECNLSKCISANEFERHAGCNSKHPNDHIYFENGETIAALVQQLKNTPYNMFPEVIQNVTGSPVNQKNFDTWKASHHQAATSELQRFND